VPSIPGLLSPLVRRDPWWDLEGRAARRTRLRIRLTTLSALGLAIMACGLTTAVWLRMLAPVAERLLG
jgi:hypothetical protein